MGTSYQINTHTRLIVGLCLMAGLMFASGIALAGDNETRLSKTTQSTKTQRDAGVDGSNSEDEYAGLVTVGERARARTLNVQSKAGATTSSTPNVDFWFYSADVELFNDHDGDGFYHGIDLLFDADTYFISAEVYAVVFLSLDGGPWNEYASTENFTIFGATSDDDYVLVTELLSGYPRGSYDILIELYDAFDNSFLADIGPESTSELAFLPLEDADRDTPVEVLPEVIVVHEGGGSTGWLLLFVLGALSVRRLLRPAGSQ